MIDFVFCIGTIGGILGMSPVGWKYQWCIGLVLIAISALIVIHCAGMEEKKKEK